MSLKRFTRDVVWPVDTITFSVLATKARNTATTMIDFLVVKAPSSYNTILGRLTLNRLRAVMSTYDLKMKFLTTVGVGEVQGEQVLTQECCVQ